MRVWLHIGLRKTGTSALQSWCAREEAGLLDRGLLYVRVRPNLPACGPLAEALRLGSPLAQAMIEGVRSQVEASGAGDALASSEGFSALRPEALRPLLDALGGHDLRLLVWLRRQDRLAEALLKQVVKWGTAAPEPESYLASLPRASLDFEALLGAWEAAHPGLRLLPQVYEEPRDGHEPDSIRAMMAALGRPDLAPEGSARLRENVSPAAGLVRLYAQVPPSRARALRRANRRVMAEWGARAGGRDDLLPPETARALRESLAPSNERVRARWFPDRPALFAAPEAEDPRPLPPEAVAAFRRYLDD